MCWNSVQCQVQQQTVTFISRIAAAFQVASLTILSNCDRWFFSLLVVVCVHGGCIGAGIDLITAADIRYCSADAVFSVKEVDVGLAADVGTLQRLPKVVGNASWVKDVCLTARTFNASEALTQGLVSAVLPDRKALYETGMKTCLAIANKSPVAVIGTKHILNYSRDHCVQDSLNYVATWNAAMLQTGRRRNAVLRHVLSGHSLISSWLCLLLCICMIVLHRGYPCSHASYIYKETAYLLQSVARTTVI